MSVARAVALLLLLSGLVPGTAAARAIGFAQGPVVGDGERYVAWDGGGGTVVLDGRDESLTTVIGPTGCGSPTAVGAGKVGWTCPQPSIRGVEQAQVLDLASGAVTGYAFEQTDAVRNSVLAPPELRLTGLGPRRLQLTIASRTTNDWVVQPPGSTSALLTGDRAPRLGSGPPTERLCGGLVREGAGEPYVYGALPPGLRAGAVSAVQASAGVVLARCGQRWRRTIRCTARPCSLVALRADLLVVRDGRRARVLRPTRRGTPRVLALPKGTSQVLLAGDRLVAAVPSAAGPASVVAMPFEAPSVRVR